MRLLPVAILACVMAVFLPDVVRAQAAGPPVKINQVRVGFRSQVPDDASGRFKVGLWVPVLVDLQAGPKGLKDADLTVETADSENAATLYTERIPALDKNDQRTVLVYAKPGNAEGRFVIAIRADGRDVLPPVSHYGSPLDLRARLYVTAGARLPDLQPALFSLRQGMVEQKNEADNRDTWPRFAAYEDNPDHLPALALGYDAVDLMILATGNVKFVERLTHDVPRTKAIAQWVRQGGRLVVSMSWNNQPEAAHFLKSPAWVPPLPVTPPANDPKAQANTVKRLIRAEEWANIIDRPFPAFGELPVDIAMLQPRTPQRPDWEVLAVQDGRPLIARMPYGRGSVTLLAFDLDKAPFTSWDGRALFLKALVNNLEPKVPQMRVENERVFPGQDLGPGNDLATQLQIALDQFDVPVIPFGWVALFILVYILIVGPLDYFLLKKVFHRLEWTWITFPTVVILVSGAAYFTAYAVKGKDLKINKVDLVDFDLRTELDDRYRTKKALAYGTTWFTIMSPRMQSYTIGIEPAVPGWWSKGEGGPTAGADVVSWLGRPEYDGPGAMARPRAQGWSRRSYSYESDATGLIGVPIPVWTSKSFMASWEATLPRLPLKADLHYHLNEDVKLTGALQSFLPGDLEDVWIFYQDKCYPLDGGLKGGAQGGAALEIKLGTPSQDISTWSQRGGGLVPGVARAAYDPTPIVKEFLFHEQADSGTNRRNHSLRRLDLSWRLQEEHKARQTNVRDAILYGRLARADGPAEELTRQPSMPTFLWLGNSPENLPGQGRTRPSLAGNLVQDTYIRVILPVRPAE